MTSQSTSTARIAGEMTGDRSGIAAASRYENERLGGER